jgi:hypothetical protein
MHSVCADAEGMPGAMSVTAAGWHYVDCQHSCASRAVTSTDVCSAANGALLQCLVVLRQPRRNKETINRAGAANHILLATTLSCVHMSHHRDALGCVSRRLCSLSCAAGQEMEALTSSTLAPP